MTEERAPVDRVAEGGTSARPAPADTAATLRIRATPADALRFARHWVRCWNERDLDGLLAHYADDVVVDSPTAARLRPDSGGRLRGKAELRDFWTYGLGLVSDLRFELTGLAVGPVTPAGPETIVLHYRNQAAQQVTEVFRVEGGKVVQATGTYRVELRAAVS
ncbi:protein of unknown function [Streptomyces murinus]|uniref:nuclear transport factor 2 family protein n=1 Tax=Streptomyces murinus TaxID=33900 RepID=UPI003D673351